MISCFSDPFKVFHDLSFHNVNSELIIHFFIVEAVESRYGQRAAYTDETRKFLFAHTPPQKRSAADTRSKAHRGGLQSRRGTKKMTRSLGALVPSLAAG